MPKKDSDKIQPTGTPGSLGKTFTITVNKAWFGNSNAASLVIGNTLYNNIHPKPVIKLK